MEGESKILNKELKEYCFKFMPIEIEAIMMIGDSCECDINLFIESVEEAKNISRVFTGSGFYTDFDAKFSDCFAERQILGDLRGEISGPDNQIGFLLFAQKGEPAVLECWALDDTSNIDFSTTEFKLAPMQDVKK